jgi:hypothetical protein
VLRGDVTDAVVDEHERWTQVHSSAMMHLLTEQCNGAAPLVRMVMPVWRPREVGQALPAVWARGNRRTAPARPAPAAAA